MGNSRGAIHPCILQRCMAIDIFWSCSLEHMMQRRTSGTTVAILPVSTSETTVAILPVSTRTSGSLQRKKEQLQRRSNSLSSMWPRPETAAGTGS